MRFNRVINPSTGLCDSLFQEHRVGPPGGCVQGSVCLRVCGCCCSTTVCRGGDGNAGDDEDGEDDDDDQRDAVSLWDVFFLGSGGGVGSPLSQRKTRVDTATVCTVPAGG